MAVVIKEPPANAVDIRDAGSIPWSGKIPWRRAGQSIPVFLPGESHGQRSLVVCGPEGCKESDRTEATEHAHRYQMSFHGLGRLINTSPGAWFALLIRQMFFSLELTMRVTETSLLPVAKASNAPTLLYLRSMSTVQPWAMVHRDLPHLPPQDSNLAHYVGDIMMIHSCEPCAATSLNLLLR